MAPLRRDQPVPLYYQVEVALRRAIELGQVPDGRLPTEEELMERYRVSRITIRTAMRRLEEDGLIERHRARGTFVRDGAIRKIERHPDHLLGFEEELRRQGATPAVEVLAVEEIEPPDGVAQALARPAAEWVYRLRRLGRANGQPLWIESRYYPQWVGARMLKHDLAGASVTRLLEEVLEVRIAGVRLRVEAAAANARQARALNVRTGHPLLVNQFALRDAKGQVLEVLRAAFRGDRYAFAFDLGARDVPQTGEEWTAPNAFDVDPRRSAVLTGHLRPEPEPQSERTPVDALTSRKEGTR